VNGFIIIQTHSDQCDLLWLHGAQKFCTCHLVQFAAWRMRRLSLTKSEQRSSSQPHKAQENGKRTLPQSRSVQVAPPFACCPTRCRACCWHSLGFDGWASVPLSVTEELHSLPSWSFRAVALGLQLVASPSSSGKSQPACFTQTAGKSVGKA
jgi:hypothetical protein